ncbi:hypothetical protein ACFOU2_19425 [Bacillus songklensis]|uniref:Tetratricopeptide repeat protein n=1 Tax=Bacillus songklensis TaxID=1069116 RepID=A0ABV8B8K4_9BACI
MSIRNKTIEELLNMQQELHLSREEEKDGSLHQLISVYEELYRRIASDENSEYASSLESIKRKLILYLVRYGTYLKTEYRKDDRAAERTLKKAIQYDRKNPIAHYRLGFLAYKQRSYLLAVTHFQHAVQYQQACSNKEYRLNNQQNYNAHLYLSNSALYIAQKAQESLERL